MNLKNSISYLLVIILLACSLVACSNDPYALYVSDDLNSKLDIGGVEFLMSKSSLEAILSSDYEESPCVYGYELEFQDKKLTIGINNDNLVRKAIVKDNSYSVFSIKVDDSKVNAINVLTTNGFSKKNSDMYINDFVSIKLLSSDDIITGIIVEKIED